MGKGFSVPIKLIGGMLIMVKQMNEYLNCMTGNDLDTLEKIISCQYRKFVKFYRLVEDYSDIIEEIGYEFNSPSSLDVSIKFNKKKDLKELKSSMDKYMSKYAYDGSVEIKKKMIFISIILEEKDEEDTE